MRKQSLHIKRATRTMVFNLGEIKKDLKLSDRVYKCKCGLSIDRDLNASINLSNYRLA